MNASASNHSPTPRFGTARDGVAALQFALLMPIFMLLGVAALDLGYAFYVKLKIVNATTAAALYAQANGSSVTATTLAAFLSNTQAVASGTADLTQAVVVTVQFNNMADASNLSQFYCLSGSPPTWAGTGSVSASCSGNFTSGKFVTIAVSTTAPGLFAYNKIFNKALTLSDFAIVRVQ